jgi:hypothetical protein
MTVFNRSNDLIWGTLGANAVHFSILQEVMAARLGLVPGWYAQISANAHVYTNNWKPQEWLAEEWDRTMYSPPRVSYDQLRLIPVGASSEDFDEELPVFVNEHADGQDYQFVWEQEGEAFLDHECPFKNTFLKTVAWPLCNAFHAYKLNHYDMATQWVEKVEAEDWKIAGQKWLDKRIGRKVQK